jgi:hypothetical protein
MHLPAFASLSALERHELDATEPLSDARRVALATIASRGKGARFSAGRWLGVLLSLVLAAGILAAVVAPSATVVVAPTASVIGPFEYDLRAGPSGDINDAQTKQDTVTRTFTSPATGSRQLEVKATGVERFTNLTTNDVRIPKGTIVQTTDGIRFQTTEDNMLGKSFLAPIFFTSITINIVAMESGPRANVDKDRITRGPSSDYTVTNPVPTAGGESRKLSVVTQSDYDNAVRTADAELQKAGDAKLAEWQRSVPKERAVYGTLVERKSITPASDVVDKTPDSGTFDLTVSGLATGYLIPAGEPRATALKRLAEEVPSENQIDTGASAKVDVVIGPTVDASGVHWRVRASSIQYARPDRLSNGSIAGRTFDEATRIAGDRGFRIVEIVPAPSWLPRLPLLDSRITIRVAPALNASGP